VQCQAADGKSIEKLLIWIVQGDGNLNASQRLTNRNPVKHGTLPDQLPDRVEVVLGRTTDQLPLFPFRITYRRTPPAVPKSTTPRLPLATFSPLNSSTSPPPPHRPPRVLYQRSDNDVDPRDITTAYIQRLGGEAKEKKLR
jgi:hypothetical protein